MSTRRDVLKLATGATAAAIIPTGHASAKAHHRRGDAAEISPLPGESFIRQLVDWLPGEIERTADAVAFLPSAGGHITTTSAGEFTMRLPADADADAWSYLVATAYAIVRNTPG